MPKFLLPTFHDARIHPSTSAINERTHAWLATLDQRLPDDLLQLGARMYATLDESVAEAGTRWLALVFIIDDDFDIAGLSVPQTKLENEIAAMLAAGTPRFRTTVAQYFASCAWERENRRLGLRPTFAEYEEMRLHTSAVLTLSEFCSRGLTLPAWSELHPYERHVGLISSYVNDLFSAKKEAGDAHNIVAILGEEKALARIHTLADELRAMHPPTAELGERLRTFVQGTIDWMPQSARYG